MVLGNREAADVVLFQKIKPKMEGLKGISVAFVWIKAHYILGFGNSSEYFPRVIIDIYVNLQNGASSCESNNMCNHFLVHCENTCFG